jgi:hypothetical protein
MGKLLSEKEKLAKRKAYSKEYWARPEVLKKKAESNFVKYHEDPKFKKNRITSFKKYYNSNKEQFIKDQKKRNEVNAEERKEYARKYYLLNKEKLKKRQSKYYKNNTEQYKAYTKKTI